jgi:hypothetical protein
VENEEGYYERSSKEVRDPSNSIISLSRDGSSVRMRKLLPSRIILTALK